MTDGAYILNVSGKQNIFCGGIIIVYICLGI